MLQFKSEMTQSFAKFSVLVASFLHKLFLSFQLAGSCLPPIYIAVKYSEAQSNTEISMFKAIDFNAYSRCMLSEALDDLAKSVRYPCN